MMSILYFTIVNRHTRAGKNGKQILCPECREWSRVYHFSWSALTCLHCKEDINKEDFIVGAKVQEGGTSKLSYSVGGKFPKRVVPLSQLQQYDAPTQVFSLYLIMPTLKLTHYEVRLLNDMFSAIADLGLFDDPSENEQDSSPDVFDKLWDKVVKL